MPQEGQKSITMSGRNLKTLERYYKEELSKNMYHISFAEFVTKHAIRDIENDKDKGREGNE